MSIRAPSLLSLGVAIAGIVGVAGSTIPATEASGRGQGPGGLCYQNGSIIKNTFNLVVRPVGQVGVGSDRQRIYSANGRLNEEALGVQKVTGADGTIVVSKDYAILHLDSFDVTYDCVGRSSDGNSFVASSTPPAWLCTSLLFSSTNGINRLDDRLYKQVDPRNTYQCNETDDRWTP